MSPGTQKTFSDIIYEMHCERNAEGSLNLKMWGNDLMQRFGRRVRDSDMVKIVSFLKRRKEVTSLEFPYNEISDCGMSVLSSFLKESPHIKHLNIMSNNISARGVGYIADAASSLYCLRLSENKFGDEGGKLLSKLLFTKNNLRYLDLADTDQTMSGLAYIMTGLMPNRGGSETLEYINISDPLPQFYHTKCDTLCAEFVSQIIGVNKNLKELHVQKHQFDFRDVEILLDGLVANSTLVCLDLNHNNIGDDGVGFLCNYLRTSPSLECLMIGSNNFGDIGATALAFNLPFSKIKLLDITKNRITDEGMMNILYTMKKEVRIRALFIWGNKLTHKSLVILQRLFTTEVLDPEHTDIEIQCVDNELQACWNGQANRYAHRFFCLLDYGHHVDARDMGLPFADWYQSPDDSYSNSSESFDTESTCEFYRKRKLEFQIDSNSTEGQDYEQYKTMKRYLEVIF